MKLGDVTTLNLTMLKAGVSSDGGKTYVSPLPYTLRRLHFLNQ